MTDLRIVNATLINPATILRFPFLPTGRALHVKRRNEKIGILLFSSSAERVVQLYLKFLELHAT